MRMAGFVTCWLPRLVSGVRCWLVLPVALSPTPCWNAAGGSNFVARCCRRLPPFGTYRRVSDVLIVDNRSHLQIIRVQKSKSCSE